VTPARRNHAIWIGPTLTFVGAVSYFTLFTRFAVTRDFPWVNLPLVLLGLAISCLGAWRGFAPATAYRGKRLGSVGLAVSLLLAGLFCFYVFGFSYRLPGPTAASLDLREAGDFRLHDQHGRAFRLGELRGRKVVLVFYRGFW
jgi:hypothetical protein